MGKKGDLHSRRLALSYLQIREAVSRLFETAAPRYGDRAGGYLRIVRTGFQKGDGAEKPFIELLGFEHELDEKRQKRAEARAKRREEIDRAMAQNPPTRRTRQRHQRLKSVWTSAKSINEGAAFSQASFCVDSCRWLPQSTSRQQSAMS